MDGEKCSGEAESREGERREGLMEQETNEEIWGWVRAGTWKKQSRRREEPVQRPRGGNMPGLCKKSERCRGPGWAGSCWPWRRRKRWAGFGAEEWQDLTLALKDRSGFYVDCRGQGKTNEEAEEPVWERDDGSSDQDGDSEVETAGGFWF